MSKVFYWLRLYSDFFKSLEIKKLRKIAGGDTYTIIYLKLQLLSLRSEGYLDFEGIEEDFSEELALALDEDVENVKVTLTYLQKVGLLKQVSDNQILLTEVPKLIGKETDKAQLMRNKRERDKENLIENGNNVTNALPQRYTEIEKEYRDREREYINTNELPLETAEPHPEQESDQRERIDYQQIADEYNSICKSFPKLTALSDARKKAIKARLKIYSLDDFKLMFQKAEASDFLKGNNNRNWSATFDWMIKDTNMVKILDGNYDNKGATHQSISQNTSNKNSFSNYPQNDVDYDELSKRIYAN